MKTAHPTHCNGCRHSVHYGVILHGHSERHGLCLRPRGHTVWGTGCRHYTEPALKLQSSICKDKL